MTKLFTALALFSPTQMAHADVDLRRCETPEKFAYWTPTPCAKGDKANGFAKISDDDQRKPYSDIVRVSECRWQEVMRDNRDNPKPHRSPGSNGPATFNWAHCK